MHLYFKANPDTHLFLQYEQMYQDTPAAIKKISEFLNIPIDHETLTKIVKNCTISEMRETSNFGLNHLRQGGYGNWRGTFTVLMSEFFDDVSTMEGCNVLLTNEYTFVFALTVIILSIFVFIFIFIFIFIFNSFVNSPLIYF